MVVVAVCKFSMASPCAAASEVLLETGSDIPGFGRVGEGGFRILDADQIGRALILGQLSDGRYGFFWVDDSGATPIWLGDESNAILFTSARTSPGGRVVGVTTFDRERRQAIYEIDASGLRLVVSSGSRDPDGSVLCEFFAASINDAGDVALAAEVAAPNQECSDGQRLSMVYLVEDGILRRVDQGSLVGLASDGTVIYGRDLGLGESGAVFAAGREGTVRIVMEGEAGPSGAPLRFISQLASSEKNVTFRASENGISGLYRTDGKEIILVTSFNAPAPGGGTWRFLSGVNSTGPVLNRNGALAVVAGWAEPDDVSVLGVILHTPDGDAVVVLEDGADPLFGRQRIAPTGNAFVNDDGEVMFVAQSYQDSGEITALIRWKAGEMRDLLRTGSEGPDDSIFAGDGLAGGLGWKPCVAPDGSVATAVKGVDGRNAIVCVDSTGVHVLARTGDPEPSGRVFHRLSGDCSFTDDGAVIFSASTLPAVGAALEGAIYRADSSGIIRVMGTGDQTNEGAFLRFDSGARFSANASGDVLAYTHSSDGSHYFLRSSAGLERVADPLGRIGNDRVTTRDGLRLTGSGGLISLASIDNSGSLSANALAEWENGDARILVRSTDVAEDGRPYGDLMSLVVHGDDFVFAARPRYERYPTRLFLYSREDPSPRLLFPPVGTKDGSRLGLEPIALNSRGQVLFEIPDGTFLIERGGPAELIRGGGGYSPMALSEDGGVYGLDFPFPNPGGLRVSLERDGGGELGDSCPRVPTPAAPPTATKTPTPTATPNIIRTCSGDCDGNGEVDVGDLVRVLKIALGQSDLSSCSSADRDSDQRVSVAEAVSAVNHAIRGCGTGKEVVAREKRWQLRKPLRTQDNRCQGGADSRLRLAISHLESYP
jgi:hypothetical protein